MSQEFEASPGVAPESDFFDTGSSVEPTSSEAPIYEVTSTVVEEKSDEMVQNTIPIVEDATNLGQNLTQVDQPVTVTVAEEENEVDALRKQVNDLMAIISQNSLNQPQPTPVQPADDKLAQAFDPLKKDATKVSTFDFFGESDHLETLSDKEKFNTLLNQVMSISYQAAVMAARDSVMRDIPSVVSTTAQQQMTIGNITKEFYEANKDLEPFKAAVSMAAQQIYNEDPSIELGQLLAKAGERTREVLRLRSTPSRRRPPAQPSGSILGGGVDRTAHPTELSPQEQQILDLLDF